MGWKALETSIKALNSIMKGWGASFVTFGHLTAHVLDLCVRQATKHVNRFVREAAFNILETISDISTTGNFINNIYSLFLIHSILKFIFPVYYILYSLFVFILR